MNSPDIALVYNKNLSSKLFEEFEKTIRNEKLSIRIEEKENDEPYACTEWFILTSAAIFIAASYFSGFLKEAGKDHYIKMKSGLSGLTNEIMSKPKIEPVILGTKGKINSNNPYTLAFSIYAEANDGNNFKLLLPKPNDIEDYTEIIYAFLEFLNNFHSGISNLGNIGFDYDITPPGKLIFVHMNLETKEIEWLDERKFR